MTRSWHVLYTCLGVIFAACGLTAGIANPMRVYHDATEAIASSETLVNLLVIGLFLILECALPAAGPRKPLRGLLLNLEVTLVATLLFPFASACFAMCAQVIDTRLGLGWIDGRIDARRGPLLTIGDIFLFALVVDFFYYWWHRFQHENQILWQEHKLHHMDEQLCALTRVSPLESLFQAVALSIPLSLVFKSDPLEGSLGTSVGVILFTWNNVFIHTNIRFSLRFLTPLITGPQIHRIHHSTLPQHFDRNYAAMFPIWDVLFGTYYHPQPDEFPPTGVHDEQEVGNFSAAIALPFREWLKMWTQWRVRRAR